MGKDAGKDLGFIESLTDVAQKREIQFEEYWPTVVREKAEFYKPTEQLILIDPKTNLPPRGSIINGNFIEISTAYSYIQEIYKNQLVRWLPKNLKFHLHHRFLLVIIELGLVKLPKRTLDWTVLLYFCYMHMLMTVLEVLYQVNGLPATTLKDLKLIQK